MKNQAANRACFEVEPAHPVGARIGDLGAPAILAAAWLCARRRFSIGAVAPDEPNPWADERRKAAKGPMPRSADRVQGAALPTGARRGSRGGVVSRHRQENIRATEAWDKVREVSRRQSSVAESPCPEAFAARLWAQ